MTIKGIRIVLLFFAFLFIVVPIGVKLFSIQVLGTSETSFLLGFGLLSLVLAEALKQIDDRLKGLESQRL